MFEVLNSQEQASIHAFIIFYPRLHRFTFSKVASSAEVYGKDTKYFIKQ